MLKQMLEDARAWDLYNGVSGKTETILIVALIVMIALCIYWFCKKK